MPEISILCDRDTEGGGWADLMYASGKDSVALAISARTWLGSVQPNMGSLYIDQYLLQQNGHSQLFALMHTLLDLGVGQTLNFMAMLPFGCPVQATGQDSLESLRDRGMQRKATLASKLCQAPDEGRSDPRLARRQKEALEGA